MAATAATEEIHGHPRQETVLHARYAYYRRCQHMKSDGEQCKAPAMKGEAICHQHAGQLDMERRRREWRREFYARSGVGLGNRTAIQKAISELAREIVAGRMDKKTVGRIMMEIQCAMRLQKMLERFARRGAPARTRQPQQARTAHAGHRNLQHRASPKPLVWGPEPVRHITEEARLCAGPESCSSAMANALHEQSSAYFGVQSTVGGAAAPALVSARAG